MILKEVNNISTRNVIKYYHYDIIYKLFSSNL